MAGTTDEILAEIRLMRDDDRTSLAGLAGRQSALEANVANIAAGLHDLRESISRLGEQFTASRTPQWGAMGTWASVIIAIGVAWGSGYIREIDKGAAEMVKIENRQNAVIQRLAGTDERMTGLEATTASERSRLEMLIDERTRDRFTGIRGGMLENRVERLENRVLLKAIE